MCMSNQITLCIKYCISLLGALKPREHCCYDICGAILHIETQPNRYGYGDTLDVIDNSVKQSVTVNNAILSEEELERIEDFLKVIIRYS